MPDDIDLIWRQLTEVYGEQKLWRPMERVRIILLSREGLTAKQIGEHLGMSSSTVKKWVNAYQKGGIKQLFPALTIEAQRSYQVFTNLLVARLAEEFFPNLLNAQLNALGLKLVDRRDEYSETDYAVVSGDSEALLINVKVHSSKFLQAEQFVGLQPDDTFPLAVYKILMGFKYERQSSNHIPFVFMVSIRWGLVDEVLRAISPEDSQLVRLVFRTRTSGKRIAEDKLVDSLVKKFKESSAWQNLSTILSEEGNHRVISANKALDIFLEKFERRCPGLVIRQFAAKFGGRKGTPAEINLHLSIGKEMTPLTEFLRILREQGIEGITNGVRDGKI